LPVIHCFLKWGIAAGIALCKYNEKQIRIYIRKFLNGHFGD